MRVGVGRTWRVARACVAVGLALPAGLAWADDAEKEHEPWNISLGAGVVSRPEYPGSKSSETRALPLVNVRHGRFFLGGVPGSGSPAGLGAYLYEDSSWNVGVVISGDVEDPRQESDDARLRGLGDIDGTARAGLFASYRVGWVTLRGSAHSDVAGKGQGTIASFDAEATFHPLPGLTLSAGPGVTWGNRSYMQTFFGIDANQAARAGLAQYQVDSGANLARVSFGAQYELTPQWSLGSRITAARLLGDAADSPVVGDRNQNTFALFVAYRLQTR
jgi:outer membrane protein